MKYFKFEEMVSSDTAKRLNIDNTPTDASIIKNINYTLENLDNIRERWGHPIIVNSGYRCVALNKAVGGVKNSHHLNGYAADIVTKGGSMRELYNLIRKEFKFTQLIWEQGGKWIHVSFIPYNLKCQAF